jgi:type IV pilus assembly protein PilY1
MMIKNSRTQLSMVIATLFAYSAASAAPLILHQSPLFLTNSEKANVLVILDNSNSMDEAANGSAVGGADPTSKSEIARAAISNLITNYTGKINMGLMAYQQAAQSLRHLHNSPYDASFDPANYNPAFTGSRDSLTKRFRVPNVSNPGAFVYFNVALPFYSNANFGNAYCYSTTADFDNGTETVAGPWDSYRCFQNKTNTSDALPIWNNGASETASGFTSFWFDGAFSPTDSDFAQNILDFGRYLTWDWVSLTWFANSSPGRGYLHIPIDELDATQAAAINVKLGTSQFVTAGPTDSTLPLQNAGLTPLEGTLLSADNYFSGGVLPANEGGPAAAIPNSCGKNFIALLTDGLPSTNSAGTIVVDPVTALADVATAASDLNANGVETYMIGFALPVGTDPTALDAIAAAGGTTSAYMADDPTTLTAAFDTIFTDILAKTGASSSAATNSTSLSTTSFIYQARFNSGDWSGQLLAKAISLSGVVSSTSAWDAQILLDAKAASSRAILTYGRDTNDGIPFRWANITGLTDTTAKDALNTDYLGVTDGIGSDRVDFLRGGTGGASSSLFRSDRTSKLGDIIHSTPIYNGAPAAGYNDSKMPGYSAFRTANLARTPVIYSGANDGMLHGFNATTGEELLAYIPREVFSNLSRLTAPGYGTSVAHNYFTDGSPLIADAKVSGSWKTVLAAGLNAGGQGVYALDVTTPTSFSEANASSIVLWEFTDEDDADLGYTYLEPTTNFQTHQSAQIVQMANGKWALIFGNGYNNTEADGHASTTGHGYLYILFIQEGTDGVWTPSSDYIKIDTGVGSTGTPNGLATPTPIDTNLDGKVDYIYAGDLYGNLWKFDVSSTTTGSWGVSIAGSQPLFAAQDSGGTSQPITSAPMVTRHPEGGYMVSFGTGKYIELSDSSTTGTQTIYGIWDQNLNISTRTLLVEQTILATLTIGSDTFRVTSTNSVDWTTKKGWFMDLPESGERVDVNPLIRDGRFVYVTRTPSTAVCAAGGNSWLMEYDYLTGGRLAISPFDVNGNGVVDSSDFVTVIIAGFPITAPVTGYHSEGMIATPTVLDDKDKEYKILSNSNGSVTSKLESKSFPIAGRSSWEEIR